MLLQALFDFTLRAQDSDKTLPFDKDDVFLFVEVYAKDENWLKVVDVQGRIGFIPKNYVEVISNCGKNECLDFIKDAIYHSKQAKLLTTDELCKIKEDLSWLEYREILSKKLRQAMSSQKSDKYRKGGTNARKSGKNSEVSDTDDKEEPTGDYLYDDRESAIHDDHHMKYDRQKKFLKAKKGYSSSSLFVAPEESAAHDVSSKPRRQLSKTDFGRESVASTNHLAHFTEQQRRSTLGNIPQANNRPVSGRTSRSCPIDPIAKKLPVDAYYDSEDNLHQSFTHEVKSPRKCLPLTRENGNVEYRGELDPHVLSLFQIVQDTGVDAKKSELIVTRLLHHISTNYQPDMPGKVQTVLKSLQQSSLATLPVSPRMSIRSNESSLHFLATVGEQSRFGGRRRKSEESLVIQQIDTLKAEVTNFEPKEAEKYLGQKNFRHLLGIVTLYSNESQQSIKDSMLDLFSHIASTSTAARKVLLSSIIPISIVQEMYDSVEDPSKLSRLAIPLITLMASGEPLPHSHHDIMGKKFISFLLNYIEEPISKDSEEEERAKRDLLNLIIAYNLQFKSDEENPVIRTIAGREPAVHFIDALLFLFERKVDPLPTSANRDLDSVLKLMKDMFSSRRCAEHFHTANMKVITDALINRVNEMRSGNKRRTEYIQLLRLVLKNKDFTYRISDVGYTFMNILLEDDPMSTEDQKLVRNICKEIPGIVSKGNISVSAGGNK